MGVLIGIIGTMFVLLDLQPNPNKITSTLPKPTLEGDFAAFIGAIAVSIYLVIGRSLRPWIPLWMYTFPVIGFAIFTSVGLAFVLEQDDSPVVWTGDPSHQIFGFLWEKNFFWISLYLGAGPGMTIFMYTFCMLLIFCRLFNVYPIHHIIIVNRSLWPYIDQWVTQIHFTIDCVNGAINRTHFWISLGILVWISTITALVILSRWNGAFVGIGVDCVGREWVS